jgi:hypothetical protein
VERQAAPGAAETISHVTLETYRSAPATVPFRVLWVIKGRIKILKRDGICCFIENYLERDSTRIALSIIVVILLMPLDDELAIRLLTDHSVIHIAAGKEVIPEWRDLVGSKWDALVRDRSVRIETIAGL